MGGECIKHRLNSASFDPRSTDFGSFRVMIVTDPCTECEKFN
jgi:hypothetical protein